MKKAQMSLEMIIGLLILLVVAYVVIKMFMSKINIDKIPKPEDTTKYIDFKAKCEGLCSDFLNYGTKASLSNYCSEKLRGIDDLNNDGLIESFEATSLSLKICEDAVYCFQIVPCKTSTGIVSWSQCRQAMCNAKYEVYKNWTKADEKVKELVPGPGTCQLPEDENWWNMYFGATPCTDPGKPPSEQDAKGQFSVTLQDCQINSADSTYTCNAQYTGTCDATDFLFLVYDSSRTNIGAVAPGNEDPPGTPRPIGTVVFENNIIRGTLVMVPNSLTAGPCYDPRLYCDMNKDGNPEVNVTTGSCQIV